MEILRHATPVPRGIRNDGVSASGFLLGMVSESSFLLWGEPQQRSPLPGICDEFGVTVAPCPELRGPSDCCTAEHRRTAFLIVKGSTRQTAHGDEPVAI